MNIRASALIDCRVGLFLFERGGVASATLPRRFLIGGIMEDKLKEVYGCLEIMDMMLYKYAYEPQAVIGFQSTEDMAKYFRHFLHVVLPEEYQYQK